MELENCADCYFFAGIDRKRFYCMIKKAETPENTAYFWKHPVENTAWNLVLTGSQSCLLLEMEHFSLMILQHLLFPTADICSEQELYYRTDGNLDMQPQLVQAESGLPLQKGVWYTFNTYFNGFSVGVWQTHTSVRRIQLRLRLFGTVQLKLLYQSSPQFDAHVVTQELGTYDLEQNGDAPRAVVLSIPLETVPAGMVSFSLQAETTGAICYGGSYETIEEPLHPKSSAPGIGSLYVSPGGVYPAKFDHAPQGIPGQPGLAFVWKPFALYRGQRRNAGCRTAGR